MPRATIRVTDAQQEAATFALVFAAARNIFGVADQLLNAGADPNLADRFGNLPLATAAKNGSLRVLRRLLDGGADPNLPAYDGTPLQAAARNGRQACAKELIGRGADRCLVDRDGMSVADLARDRETRRIVMLYKPRADRARPRRRHAPAAEKEM